MAISFRAKPPPYAISWRVFQRIVEHHPRARNFVKGEGEKRSHDLRNREASLRSKFSHGEDVHANFGLNSQSEKALFCFNPRNNRTSTINCY
jgi:hypothetical protein